MIGMLLIVGCIGEMQNDSESGWVLWFTGFSLPLSSPNVRDSIFEHSRCGNRALTSIDLFLYSVGY